MKNILRVGALLISFCFALPALAQPPSPPPTKLFTAGADIPALIAQAKAAQKSPTVNSVVPIALVGPYRVLLEYRTGLTPPTIHHGQAELIQVIRGNATLVTAASSPASRRPGRARPMKAPPALKARRRRN